VEDEDGELEVLEGCGCHFAYFGAVGGECSVLMRQCMVAMREFLGAAYSLLGVLGCDEGGA